MLELVAVLVLGTGAALAQPVGAQSPAGQRWPLTLASPRAVLVLGATRFLLQSSGMLSPGEAVACKEGLGRAGVS